MKPSPVRAIPDSASAQRSRSVSDSGRPVHAGDANACSEIPGTTVHAMAGPMSQESSGSPRWWRSAGRDGVEDGPLDLGRTSGRSSLLAVGVAQVERVDDRLAERLHLGRADVEVELGERSGDPVAADRPRRRRAPRARWRRPRRRCRSGRWAGWSPATGAGRRCGPARPAGPRPPAGRRGRARGRPPTRSQSMITERKPTGHPELLDRPSRHRRTRRRPARRARAARGRRRPG